MLNHAETVAAALKTFETLNDELSQLYRQVARENAKGYDRPETNAKIDAAEKAEHDAWIAYRAAEQAVPCGWGCGSIEPWVDDYPGLVYPHCPSCGGN
jgi:hypothetical protein